MKEEIHPELSEITVKCACGNTFETLSTKEDLHVDVCSECHPFFSEGDRFLDSEGRISKFEKKYGIESEESETEDMEDIEEAEEKTEEGAEAEVESDEEEVKAKIVTEKEKEEEEEETESE